MANRKPLKILHARKNNSTKAILRNMLLAAVSLFVNGFGIYLTIQANIGVAPWDVLNTGLSLVTVIGYLLGGSVGIGTLLSAFCSGPILQLVFRLAKFDATAIKHQQLADSFAVISWNRKIER